MSEFVKNHRPGEGVGHKPPMDNTVFTWLCINTTAIIILTGVIVHTLLAIGG